MDDWAIWAERIVLLGAAFGALRLMLSPVFKAASRVFARSLMEVSLSSRSQFSPK